MNPEAGLIESPFRRAVETLARANPKMPCAEVYLLARASIGTARVMEKYESICPYYKYSGQQVDVVAKVVSEEVQEELF